MDDKEKGTNGRGGEGKGREETSRHDWSPRLSAGIKIQGFHHFASGGAETHHVELILGDFRPGFSLGSALIPHWVVRVQQRVGYRGQGRAEVTPRRARGGMVHVGYFMRSSAERARDCR